MTDTVTTTPAPPSVLEILTLTPSGKTDTFLGRSPVVPGRRNLFGGQVMAQALRAAAATVDADRPPHSLHATFLREGQFDTDVEFEVLRTRDGRTFSARHVLARQGDRVILTLSASFHMDEPGREYSSAPREVAAPSENEGQPEPNDMDTVYGIEVVRRETPALRDDEHAAYTFWARTAASLPDDRVLDACVAAYISDFGTGSVAAAAVDLPVDRHDGTGPIMASLDHAMWFHRPAPATDWLLVDAVPVSSQHSRGLIRGTVHDGSGMHVASFVQELLVRER